MVKISFEITEEEVQRTAGRKLGKVQIKNVLEAIENDSVLWNEIEKSIKSAIAAVTS